jgi:hypothetical protein
MALHAKAKAEAGYRFYALYDKIYREDILAHAYAQCRSNKGAPGVDGQDFADRRHMMRSRKRKGFGWLNWSRQWLYETVGLFNGYRVRRATPKGAPA